MSTIYIVKRGDMYRTGNGQWAREQVFARRRACLATARAAAQLCGGRVVRLVPRKAAPR